MRSEGSHRPCTCEGECYGRGTANTKSSKQNQARRPGPVEKDKMKTGRAMFTRTLLGCHEECGHYSEQNGKSLKTLYRGVT